MASKTIFEAKQKVVEEITNKIKAASSIVIVDYKGLTVAEDTELRCNLRKAGVEYRVMKNRLVKIAMNNLGFTEFDNDLNGTTAVAFGSEDPVAPAKILLEASKKYNKITVKSGMVEGKPIDHTGVTALAELPPKEIMVAKMLGTLQAPITGFVRVLNGTIAGLAIALKAIADKQAENN